MVSTIEKHTHALENLMFSAYIAGLVDGEGSLMMYTRMDSNGKYIQSNFELSITNTHKRVLEEIHAFYGAGKVSLRSKATPTHQAVYAYRITKKSAIRTIVNDILPFLRIKLPQAVLMLECLDIIKDSKQLIEHGETLKKMKRAYNAD